MSFTSMHDASQRSELTTLDTFGVLNYVVLLCCVLCRCIRLSQNTEVEGSGIDHLRQCTTQVNAAGAVL